MPFAIELDRYSAQTESAPLRIKAYSYGPMGTRPAFLPIVLVPLLLVAACSSEQSTTREEVIERYEGGEKRVVAVYEGTGTEETLVKRTTYAPSGQLIKVENLVQDSTLTFEDLQNQYAKADSLQAYLTRAVWINTGNDTDGESGTGIDIYTPDSLYEISSDGEFILGTSSSVDYLNQFRIRTVLSSDDEPTTTRIHLVGPDRIEYGDRNNQDGVYRRVKVEEIKSPKLRKAIAELGPQHN